MDSASFFLHPQGKFQPDSEFKADTAAIFDTAAKDDAHFICRFPARFKWIRAHYKFNRPFPAPLCREYENFKQTLSVDSVSLVFASSYINSPPSAFGHVYLKLHHARPYESFGLTDYTVNFGARLEGADPLRMVLYGFTGQFKGYYTVVPFDFDIRKYAYLDKRDEWIFPLNLTPEEIDRIVDHLWELRQGYMHYYFLTGNCAYYIYALLEASCFGLNIPAQPITTPLSVLHALNDKTRLLGESQYVPSLKNQMLLQVSGLTRTEKIRLKSFIQHGYDAAAVSGSPDTSKAKIVDVAELQMDYKYGSRVVQDSLLRRKQMELSMARSTLPDYLAPSYPEGVPPTLSHKASSLEVAYQVRRDAPSAFLMETMPAFHGRLDDGGGIGETFEMRMLVLDLAYVPSEQDLRFNKFVVLDLFNFEPNSYLTPNLSWKTTLNLSDDPAEGDTRLNGNVLMGLGKSMPATLSDRFVFIALGTTGLKWFFDGTGADPFVGVFSGLHLIATPRNKVEADVDFKSYLREGPAWCFSVKHQFNFRPDFGLKQSVELSTLNRLEVDYQLGAIVHF